MQRYGFEREGYFGSFTLAATISQQSGDVDDASYGTLDLRWYALENLMVETGGSFADDNNDRGHIGAEYQIVAGLTAFAEAAWGDDDYDHACGGLRYYFGAEKSLIKCHREGDPRNNVVGNALQALGNIGEAETGGMTVIDPPGDF